MYQIHSIFSLPPNSSVANGGDSHDNDNIATDDNDTMTVTTTVDGARAWPMHKG